MLGPNSNFVSQCLQDMRGQVKLLIQLADSLVESGHIHAGLVKQWVAVVDQRYKDFSARLDQYSVELEDSLDITPAPDQDSDNNAKDTRDVKQASDEKRRSARRKE